MTRAWEERFKGIVPMVTLDGKKLRVDGTIVKAGCGPRQRGGRPPGYMVDRVCMDIPLDWPGTRSAPDPDQVENHALDPGQSEA